MQSQIQVSFQAADCSSLQLLLLEVVDEKC